MDVNLTLVLAVAAVACLAMLIATVVLFVKVFRTRALLRQAGVPLSNRAAYWGALIYVVSPVDLLPDPVYLDDIGVLLLALRSLHAVSAKAVGGPRRRERQRTDA
ncbi:YkvA family protein [Streptomyces sp. NBC_01716]|uniref:YkvA family protein n=1 Tax=Streptomyces sp. NBC_01716 TaxID=2975917 RepID=UPI002E37984B|nr:YkvA family protein [Streptomyces sp. NBC_01716]